MLSVTCSLFDILKIVLIYLTNSIYYAITRGSYKGFLKYLRRASPIYYWALSIIYIYAIKVLDCYGI